MPGRGPLARLRRAHRLRAEGDFGRASAEYLALAGAAHRRGYPQAARLYVAAGMAAVDAGEETQGVETLLRGLAEFNPPERSTRVAHRIIEELRLRGHDSAADRIETYLVERGIDPQAPYENPAKAATLPPKCPNCGGTVQPDEVEWTSSREAVCDYCGSVLQAES